MSDKTSSSNDEADHDSDDSPTGGTFVTPQSCEIISLQVGDRCFKIARDLLCNNAKYFASAHLAPPPRTADGSSLVHANADIFQYIVDFCMFGTFPLLMEGKSLALGKYTQLYQQARYFQVDKLSSWIQRRQYDEVIKIVTRHNQRVASEVIEYVVTGTAELTYHFFSKSKKVWQCPRGLHVHEGPPGYNVGQVCGKECAKKGEGEWVEEKTQWVDIVQTILEVDFEKLICRD